MTFKNWAKLQEGESSTSNVPQASPVRDYRRFQPTPPKGSPSGASHSDPKLEEARVVLGKLHKTALNVLNFVKTSDQWKNPNFQKSFLAKMTKAIDGLSESQVLVSADPKAGRPEGYNGP